MRVILIKLFVYLLHQFYFLGWTWYCHFVDVCTNSPRRLSSTGICVIAVSCTLAGTWAEATSKMNENIYFEEFRDLEWITL